MADKTDNSRYHGALASLRETFKIRFHGHLGNELVALEPGRAVIQLNASDIHLNAHGFVHGGVLATLLDSACGYSGLMEASVLRRNQWPFQSSPETSEQGALRRRG